MRKLISLFTLFAVFFVYNSCAPLADTDGDLLFGVIPPKDGSTGGTGSGSTSSGSIIKKFSGVDQDGTPYAISYTYTGNVLSKVSYPNNQFFDISYTNGTISKIIGNSNENGTAVQTTYTLIYTGNQVTKVNEAMELAPGIIQNATSVITYSNGKVTKVKRSVYSDETPPVEILYLTFDIEYNGDNVSKFTLSTGSDLAPIPPTTTSISYSTYDGKNNPFNTLPKEFNIATLFTVNASLAENGFSRNNAGKIFVGSDSSTLTYIYNKDNFPISAKGNSETATYEYY